MESNLKVANSADSPQIVFLKRILGNQSVLANESVRMVSEGIQLSVHNFIFSTLENEPEEKTYLNFFPVEDGRSYLQLSFFPEYNLKESDNFYQIIQIIFYPEYFRQWPQDVLSKIQPFRFDRSTEQAINLPPCSREPIVSLLNNNEPTFLEALRQHEIATFLLRLSLEAFLNPDESSKMPACSFLNNSNEREKVLEAHSIILNRLDNPVTIRELARQIGMNECYLKKGFKAMYGKTIHELQQFERIEKAKELLKLNKYSINEVAYKMGFGSASHFSTSFKKIAGMKPCELLG